MHIDMKFKFISFIASSVKINTPGINWNHHNKHLHVDYELAYKQAHIGVQARIACGVAMRAKLSGEAPRQESEPALISANFSFPPRKPQKKNMPTNFHRKYKRWQLIFLGKIVNLFHNNMQAQYTLLIEKTVKVYIKRGPKWSCFLQSGL